jgi:hypothetical protein
MSQKTTDHGSSSALTQATESLELTEFKQVDEIRGNSSWPEEMSNTFKILVEKREGNKLV